MAKTVSKNEFEEIQESVPEQEFSEVPEANDMIAAGSAGVEYDWSKAPSGVKAPPRTNLDKKIVTIKEAKILLPPEDRPWEKTKAGDKEFKYCTFILYYDAEGQQEFYSGVRTFKRVIKENGVEKVKMSHPTITKDMKNQASQLMGLYAKFKSKDINEVSLREFMGFLNSKPKVRLTKKDVTNPQTNEVIHKNMVEEFLNS